LGFSGKYPPFFRRKHPGLESLYGGVGVEIPEGWREKWFAWRPVLAGIITWEALSRTTAEEIMDMHDALDLQAWIELESRKINADN
jgi:hypothetical protein